MGGMPPRPSYCQMCAARWSDGHDCGTGSSEGGEMPTGICVGYRPTPKPEIKGKRRVGRKARWRRRS